MKEPKTQLRDWVIVSAADDYESFEIITKGTLRLAAVRGISLTENAVRAALEDAISKGYLESYRLSSTQPHVSKVRYSRDRIRELWFFVTPRGERLARRVAKDLSKP
jgi:hypothetical protein